MSDLGQAGLEDLIHDSLVGLDDDEGTYGWGGVWNRDGKLMLIYHGSTYELTLKKVED